MADNRFRQLLCANAQETLKRIRVCVSLEVRPALFNFIGLLCHSCLERSVIFYLVAVVVLLFRACRNSITGLCSVCCHSVIKVSYTTWLAGSLQKLGVLAGFLNPFVGSMEQL